MLAGGKHELSSGFTVTFYLCKTLDTHDVFCDDKEKGLGGFATQALTLVW